MTITHIVLFQFKPKATLQAIQAACDQMLALKEKCLHPDSGQPYIKSASGGRDNSPEGKQGGITHAFVMLFTSLPDRDYYLFQDPVHQEFAESLGDLVEKVQVVDYTSSVL